MKRRMFSSARDAIRDIATLGLTETERQAAEQACRATNEARKRSDPNWTALPCVDAYGHCCKACEQVARNPA